MYFCFCYYVILLRILYKKTAVFYTDFSNLLWNWWGESFTGCLVLGRSSEWNTESRVNRKKYSALETTHWPRIKFRNLNGRQAKKAKAWGRNSQVLTSRACDTRPRDHRDQYDGGNDRQRCHFDRAADTLSPGTVSTGMIDDRAIMASVCAR